MTLAIALIGCGFATFFGLLVWKLSRQERLRSAARVAMLSDAIDNATPSPATGTVDVQPAFLSPDAPSTTTAHSGVLRLAIGAAASVALIVTIAMLSAGRTPGADPKATNAATAAADGALELLSMRHERAADTLTVTGLVRNGGSAPAQRLIAVVFAFDRSGNFMASGRAPLEFLSLAPGDESPFRVSVPNVGDVGRYRVSFRTESGVVRHVDRRQALVARSAQ